MKIVLFGLSLILVTTAHAAKLTYTWDKKEIESLKGKEVYSFYCTPKIAGFTKEVCDRVSKSASFKKFKFKTLEWVDSTTIRVGDGPRTVEVKHGTRPGSFTMNGKFFDYGTMTHDQVRERIAAAMPRVGGGSLFMNAAYAEAELGDIVKELENAVQLMGAYKSDTEICETWQRVAMLCEEDDTVKPNDEKVIAAVKKYTSQKTRDDQRLAGKAALAAIENFRSLIEQARDLVSKASELGVHCSAEFREMAPQPEDISHYCTGQLSTFKIKFDQKINEMVLDDAIARTTHKNVKLKFYEVVEQMETFFQKPLSYYDKREVEAAVKAAKPVQ